MFTPFGPYDLNLFAQRSHNKSNSTRAIPGNHFVSTRGQDTGDGSTENPYRTIQRAVDQAVAGDTIYVAPGVYTENVIVDKRLSIMGFDRGEVTLQSGVDGTFVLDLSAAVGSVISDMTIQANDNGVDPGPGFGSPLAIIFSAPGVRVQNCVIQTNPAINTPLASAPAGFLNSAGDVSNFRDCNFNVVGRPIDMLGGGTITLSRCNVSGLSSGPEVDGILLDATAAPCTFNATDCVFTNSAASTGPVLIGSSSGIGAVDLIGNIVNCSFEKLGAVGLVAPAGFVIDLTDGGGGGDTNWFSSGTIYRPDKNQGDTPVGATVNFGGAGVIRYLGTNDRLDQGSLGASVILETGDAGVNGGNQYVSNRSFTGAGVVMAEVVAVDWTTRIPRSTEEAIGRLMKAVSGLLAGPVP